MLTAKRVVSLLLCLCMLIGTLVMGGCSTPAVAMTVDGEEFTMGDFLSYMYVLYANIYYNQYYYYYETQMGTDFMQQTFSYNGESLKADEYFKQVAQDTIVYQKALENMMAEKGIKPDAEEIKKIEDELKGFTNTTPMEYLTGKSAIDMGFTFDKYLKAYKRYMTNASSLFYGLYDKDGERAVKDETIRDYFDKNYYSYKSINVTLQDSNGKNLDDAAKAKEKEKLEKYLALYNKKIEEGMDPSAAFDAVIEQHKEDNKSEEDKKKEEEENKKDEENKDDTADKNETADKDDTADKDEADKDTADKDTADKDDADKDDADKEEEEKTDPNRVNVTTNSGDKDTLEAIGKLKFDEVKIVEYNAGGTTPTYSLVLRLDPEKGVGAYKFDDVRRSIIYDLEFEKFDKEIKEIAKTLTVDVNNRAIRMATIEEFRAN